MMITNRNQQKQSLGLSSSSSVSDVRTRPTKQRQYTNSNIALMILFGILFWCVYSIITIEKYTATIPNHQLQTQQQLLLQQQQQIQKQLEQLQQQQQQQQPQNSSAFIPPQQQLKQEQQDSAVAYNPLHVPSDDTNDNGNNNVLIIATIPRSHRHVIALWSQLECLSGMQGGKSSYSKIVLSTSTSSEGHMQFMLPEIQTKLGHELPPIEVQYHVNDRYDVGLWCDAMTDLGYVDGFANPANVPFDNTIMTNDSFFALRPFDGVLEKLRSSKRLNLVGLTSSNTRGYWLESFYRGFSSNGIKKFMHRSCKDASHPSFGAKLGRMWRKRRIVQYHEIRVAYQYHRNSLASLFSADPPAEGWFYANNNTWVQNIELWKWLVNEHQFPVAKVNIPDMIPDAQHSPLLEQCTQKLSPEFLKSISFEKDSNVGHEEGHEEDYEEDYEEDHEEEMQEKDALDQEEDTKMTTTTKNKTVSISQVESNALQQR